MKGQVKALKRVHAPNLHRDVVFGRKRSPLGAKKLHLADYLRQFTLPPSPPSADYSAAAQPSLTQIFGNDALGDCVIAGANHILGVETGNAGSCLVTPEAQVVKEYSAVGGYVPGNPATDQGCDLVTALNYYSTTGFTNGTKLLAWLAINGSNVAEIQAALFLFENLYFGMELPDAWISPFPSGDGFVWDVAGAQDPNNGHCVMGAAYDSRGVSKLASWGLQGVLTYAAIAEYATGKTGGELYVLLSPDQLAKGQSKAPNGVAWSDILADFNAMGGAIPLPSPAPSPVPGPTPPGTPVTLALAQSWAAAGIANGDALQTRAQASDAAAKGLAAGWPPGTP